MFQGRGAVGCGLANLDGQRGLQLECLNEVVAMRYVYQGGGVIRVVSQYVGCFRLGVLCKGSIKRRLGTQGHSVSMSID